MRKKNIPFGQKLFISKYREECLEENKERKENKRGEMRTHKYIQNYIVNIIPLIFSQIIDITNHVRSVFGYLTKKTTQTQNHIFKPKNKQTNKQSM